MKKGIIVFMCILLIISLVGCSNNTENKETQSEDIEKTEVTEKSSEENIITKEENSIFVENKKLSQYKEITSDKIIIEIQYGIDSETELNCFLVGGNGWVNEESDYIFGNNLSNISNSNDSVVLTMKEDIEKNIKVKELVIDFSKIDESVSHIDLYSILNNLSIEQYTVRILDKEGQELLLEDLIKESNSLEVLRLYKIENIWYLDFSNRQTDLTSLQLAELYKVYR